MEEIYKFQRDFLRELESKVDRDHMDCSKIGSVFVINVSYVYIYMYLYMYMYNVCTYCILDLCLSQKHEFAIYSQYCNNHPHAVNEMNILQQNEQYTLFFEVSSISYIKALYTVHVYVLRVESVWMVHVCVCDIVYMYIDVNYFTAV